MIPYNKDSIVPSMYLNVELQEILNDIKKRYFNELLEFKIKENNKIINKRMKIDNLLKIENRTFERVGYIIKINQYLISFKIIKNENKTDYDTCEI